MGAGECGKTRRESQEIKEVALIGWPSRVDLELKYVRVEANGLTWNRPSS